MSSAKNLTALVAYENQSVGRVFPPDCNERLMEGLEQLAALTQGRMSNVLCDLGVMDTAPGSAFPEANIRYVSPNREQTDILIKHGHHACFGQIAGKPDDPLPDNFREVPPVYPDSQDLLIMIEPNSPVNVAMQCVRQDGYVICNNARGVAGVMNSSKQMEIVAASLTRKNGASELCTESLEYYFVDITSDDSFLKRNTEDYWKIRRLITGTSKPKLLKWFFNTAPKPVIAQYVALVNKEGINLPGGRVRIGREVFPAPLKVVKSGPEDLFLFQKH